MKYSWDEIKTYTGNAPKYVNGLAFVQSGYEKKDVMALVEWLRSFCNKTEGLSFRLVISSHEAKGYIQKVQEKTGKRGRPKTVVKGNEAKPHVHLCIVNTNPLIKLSSIKEPVTKYVRKRRVKRLNLRQHKTQPLWVSNLSYVSYMDRQSDHTYRGGNFDFDYFLNPLYCPIQDEESTIFEQKLDV